ncbi:EF-hand domain-containing protein [Pseudoblastomonas halimionae]|uniref:EF-hand domain-containing protein n=1 Tax=Alteriqipengyuania halimionae TaxID=1926630 RepID=A0A6I4TZR3_9SPHN|nr:EF-hand domain-containing protein [Alteriqipengyuania halimionae]MXP09299.1 hypothetical protein [Alteriqipengyuania halimionae]
MPAPMACTCHGEGNRHRTRCLAPRENGTLAKADLRKAFDRMDKDGSGFIESGEASNIRLSKVDGSKSGEKTEQTGRSAVALFDDDQDGRVSYDEFENWFASSLIRAGAVAED